MNIMLDEGAIKPTRAHNLDAGLDLYTTRRVVIRPDSSAIFDTGVHIQLPEGFFGKIESKSGLNCNHGIVSLGGVIDAGYTGSIKVKLYNFGYEHYVFNPGDKIAQLIIQPCVLTELTEVREFESTDRGDKGFGSSGK